MNGSVTVHHLKPFSLLVMIVLLVGCVSKPDYRYYSLRALSASSSVAGASQLSNISVGLMPVHAPEWLDKQNISYSNGAYRLYQADFDRWGEPLPKMMTQVLMSNLNQVSPTLDISVGPWDRSQRPEYIVSVEIVDLAVEDNVLTFEIRWDAKGGQQRSVKSFYEKIEQPLADSSYESIARGCSQVISKLSRVMVAGLQGGIRK